jgi:hypothetical protein
MEGIMRTEPTRTTKTIPPPDPQLLHNRAGDSAKETRQTIITLATGSLAVFFLALTSEIKPPLTDVQQATVLIAMVAMALAIFAGLWSAYADAQWSYHWADQVEKIKYLGEKGIPEQKGVDDWHFHKGWSEKAEILFFVIGVLVSVGYIALRVFP